MNKAITLDCDSIIFDLEDSVGPAHKKEARSALQAWFAAKSNDAEQELIIRINDPASPWGTEDLQAACQCEPAAILLPKVESAQHIAQAEEAIDRLIGTNCTKLWAMIETPLAIANCLEIASTTRRDAGRLDCLVAGTNDLAKETAVEMDPQRTYFVSWLMQMILAARACNLDVLDGVFNGLGDPDGFEAECRQGKAMGFDGKTLIHPRQIEPANRIFSPTQEAIDDATRVVEAFAEPENLGKGVIQLDGRMVERLHLAQAEAVLAKAAKQNPRKEPTQ